MVLAQKQDGKLWFCINLCRLNNITMNDTYSLPRIHDTLECLWGTVWFISLDLKLGYWQVRMKEKCKAYTAFTVDPLGFYECKHIPIGLTNTPTTFQHLMEMCLGDLQINWCIIYLDSIIVSVAIPKENLNRLWAVFTTLWGAELKFKPTKCDF